MARRFRFLIACGLVALACSAAGQQANDQAAQALARAQGLLRQLAQEKAALDTELAKLRAENAKLRKDAGANEARLADTEAGLESATRETAGVRASLARTEQRLARTDAKLRDVVARYKAQALKLRDTEAERGELQSRLEATAHELEDAERKNLALYKLNRQILAEFDRVGPWEGLLRKEPFTGLKRVEIENLTQEYEHKLQDQVRDGNLNAVVEEAKH